MRGYARAHTHSHTRRTLTPAPAHTHSHSRTHTHTLTRTNSHTRTLIHALSYTHSHTRTLIHALALTRTHSRTRTHALALTHFESHMRPHRHALASARTDTRTHAHAHVRAQALRKGPSSRLPGSKTGSSCQRSNLKPLKGTGTGAAPCAIHCVCCLGAGIIANFKEIESSLWRPGPIMIVKALNVLAYSAEGRLGWTVFPGGGGPGISGLLTSRLPVSKSHGHFQADTSGPLRFRVPGPSSRK